jgi:hypothetical protein
MKVLKRVLLVAGCLAALNIGVGNVAAQNGGGGGGGGMQQFRQRRIDGMRDSMEVKDDAEWKVISDSLGKVMDAQMSAMASRFGGGGRRGGGNGGGDNASADNGGQRPRRFGPQPSAEAEALQKAIDAKAPADEIKSKLAALREANKANEAKLEEAQSDLKKLLTSRQEAVAVLNGFLK